MSLEHHGHYAYLSSGISSLKKNMRSFTFFSVSLKTYKANILCGAIYGMLWAAS